MSLREPSGRVWHMNQRYLSGNVVVGRYMVNCANVKDCYSKETATLKLGVVKLQGSRDRANGISLEKNGEHRINVIGVQCNSCAIIDIASDNRSCTITRNIEESHQSIKNENWDMPSDKKSINLWEAIDEYSFSSSSRNGHYKLLFADEQKILLDKHTACPYCKVGMSRNKTNEVDCGVTINPRKAPDFKTGGDEIMQEMKRMEFGVENTHVVQLLDHNEEFERYLILMERIRGYNLLDRVHSRVVALSGQQPVIINAQLSEKLGYHYKNRGGDKNLEHSHILFLHHDM